METAHAKERRGSDKVASGGLFPFIRKTNRSKATESKASSQVAATRQAGSENIELGRTLDPDSQAEHSRKKRDNRGNGSSHSAILA